MSLVDDDRFVMLVNAQDEAIDATDLTADTTEALAEAVETLETADAVVVRDELPESLAFESSQPEAQRTGSILSWNLSNVPAGSERTILLKAKPTKVGAFDHAATVTLRAGGKSQTSVISCTLSATAFGKIMTHSARSSQSTAY